MSVVQFVALSLLVVLATPATAISLLQMQFGGLRSRAAQPLDAALLAACVPPGMRAAPVKGQNFSMVVLGVNDIVSQDVVTQGFWEVRSPGEMAAKAGATLPDGAVLLDIGANIGYYTLLFANVGHRVVAVEPMTRNRQALEGSLCLNPHLRNLVTVVPAALVDTKEQQTVKHCIVKSTNYAINIGNGYLNCSAAASCAPGDVNCEQVPTKTLDMVLAEVAPKAVDVVKMDVESYECNVFAGGASLFEKYHPRLLQVETAWGNSSQCVSEAASKYSYDLVKDGANTEMKQRSRMSLVQRH